MGDDLVHAAHVWCSGSLFFRQIDDEGTHSNGGSSDASSALDGFFGDFGWVDNSGFFEVNNSLFGRHDIDTEARFGFFDFSEKSLRIEAGIFHDMDEWGFEGFLDDLGAIVVGFERSGEID